MTYLDIEANNCDCEWDLDEFGFFNDNYNIYHPYKIY